MRHWCRAGGRRAGLPSVRRPGPLTTRRRFWLVPTPGWRSDRVRGAPYGTVGRRRSHPGAAAVPRLEAALALWPIPRLSAYRYARACTRRTGSRCASSPMCRALVTVRTLAAAHRAETAFLLICFPWQAFGMSEQTRRRGDFRLLIIGEILLGIGLITGALLLAALSDPTPSWVPTVTGDGAAAKAADSTTPALRWSLRPPAH